MTGIVESSSAIRRAGKALKTTAAAFATRHVAWIRAPSRACAIPSVRKAKMTRAPLSARGRGAPSTVVRAAACAKPVLVPG
jgi:hypothetical protein